MYAYIYIYRRTTDGNVQAPKGGAARGVGARDCDTFVRRKRLHIKEDKNIGESSSYRFVIPSRVEKACS